MRVALINQPLGILEVPDPASSLSIWVYEVARRLALQCDVIVFSRKGAKQQLQEFLHGVSYTRIDCSKDTTLSNFLEKTKWLRRGRPICESRFYYRNYAIKIAENIRHSNIDVVHILNFAQFIPIIRRINPRIKIVLHMQCEWLNQLDRKLISRRIAPADCIVGCSGYITGKIQKRFPEFAGKCCTVYNGVELPHDSHLRADAEADLSAAQETRTVTNAIASAGKTEPQKKSKRLLFVGRISPEKGLHVLIDAFKIVKASDPSVHLDVVGPEWVCPPEMLVNLDRDGKLGSLREFFNGSYKSKLQQRLPAGMKNDVAFVGSAPHSRVMEYYRGCDMLVNASLSDASAMPLAEAMGCQVPIIATRVGGTPEIVQDGKTGLLVQPDDTRGLANAILKLCGDRKLRLDMGSAGRRRAMELFSWDKIANDMLRKYNQLLGLL